MRSLRFADKRRGVMGSQGDQGYGMFPDEWAMFAFVARHTDATGKVVSSPAGGPAWWVAEAAADLGRWLDTGDTENVAGLDAATSDVLFAHCRRVVHHPDNEWLYEALDRAERDHKRA